MFEKIAKYLADQLDIAVEDIKPETTFESLGIDSWKKSWAWSWSSKRRFPPSASWWTLWRARWSNSAHLNNRIFALSRLGL